MMIPALWLVQLGFLTVLTAADARAAEPSVRATKIYGQLDQLGGEVTLLGTKLSGLGSTYLTPSAIAGVASYSARLADAEILVLLGDYARACWILYDLAAAVEHRNEPLYPKALYYFGESLFQIGHDLSARGVFMDIVALGAHEHLADAVRRLIEIADRTGNFGGITDQLDVLRKKGPLPADISYIYAKSLLRQKRFEAVAPAIASISAQHALYPKAQYVLAVAKLQQGELDAARDLFAGLKQVSDNYENAAEIRDLAAMNQARILLEQGRTTEAIDAYQFVSRGSPLFEQALYEISWTYVRAANQATDPNERDAQFLKAQKTLEILLLSETQTPVMSEARLLLGNIYLRLSQFEPAEATFRDVVRAFGPLRDQLTTLVDPPANPAATLYARAIAAPSESLVAGLPAAWTADEPALQRAVAVAASVQMSETWTNDAEALAENVLNALKSDRRSSLFPSLSEAQRSARGFRDTLLKLTERLLDVQLDLARDKLDEGGRHEIAELARTRSEHRPSALAASGAKLQPDSETVERDRRILAIEQQVLRAQFELAARRAQLNGIDVWRREHPGMLQPDEEAEFRERERHEEAVVIEQEKHQRELAEAIARERERWTAEASGEATQSDSRWRYQTELTREREIVEAAMPSLPPEWKDAADTVERLWGLLAGEMAELDRFDSQLNAVVAERASGVQAEVLREQGLLAQYDKDIKAVRTEAQQVVGDVATGSLREVRRRLRDMVLRADVGIVDVAWAEKEVETREISRHVNEQRRELQVLDNEYGEVVQGP
jgi:tetratricopeptide (TPR) repeat protein